MFVCRNSKPTILKLFGKRALKSLGAARLADDEEDSAIALSWLKKKISYVIWLMPSLLLRPVSTPVFLTWVLPRCAPGYLPHFCCAYRLVHVPRLYYFLYFCHSSCIAVLTGIGSLFSEGWFYFKIS